MEFTTIEPAGNKPQTMVSVPPDKGVREEPEHTWLLKRWRDDEDDLILIPMNRLISAH